MSDKRVLNALIILGLPETDIKIYIYLATNGPRESDNIADALGLREDVLCASLGSLQNKGIVASVLKESDFFYARPFDEVLEILVKTRLNEVQETEKAKDEILFLWRTMTNDSTIPVNNHKS